jgi:hypothetical protein
MTAKSDRETARHRLANAMMRERDQLLINGELEPERARELADAMSKQIDSIYRRWGWLS